MKKSYLPQIITYVVIILALASLGYFIRLVNIRKEDRSACIINIRNVQQAARAYYGMNSRQPSAEQMWKDIFTGPDRFMDTPKCPSGGTYTFHKPSNICAPPGFIFCTCSHAKSINHIPADTTDW